MFSSVKPASRSALLAFAVYFHRSPGVGFATLKKREAPPESPRPGACGRSWIANVDVPSMPSPRDPLLTVPGRSPLCASSIATAHPGS